MKRRPFYGLGALMTALALFLCPSMDVRAASRLQDTGDNIVIVIDPGHGGDNRGTLENGHEEKFMTMITARAMYDELKKYDDVEVYLTRNTDVDLTLKERAEFAASVGSEVWVPMEAPYNGYGLQFGYEFLTWARQSGLLVRGVKTRPGDKGDYYGVIRESVALDVPALIIEHCHVDHSQDEEYCDSDEDLKNFGISDATAVAKYFGLKSSALNVDYSDYSLIQASAASLNELTRNDDTDPEFCEISLNDADYNNGKLSVDVMAADYDTPLLYYDYSLDGGSTFSERQPWPDGDTLSGTCRDTFTLELDIPDNTSPTVILRAYNPYDLYAESNPLTGLRTFHTEGQNAEQEADGNAASAQQENKSSDEQAAASSADEAAAAITSDPADLGMRGDNRILGEAEGWQDNLGDLLDNASATQAASSSVEGEHEVSFLNFLKLCLVFVLLLFVVILISQTISYHKRKRHRRQRRNDKGDNRYHKT